MSKRKAKAWARLYSRDSTSRSPAVEQRSVTMSNTAPNREAFQRGRERGNAVKVKLGEGIEQKEADKSPRVRSS